MLTRKIIHIDEELCNGCGECIVNCKEAALEIIDGKARVVADRFCDGLGECMGHCPTGALSMVEREAEPFDEKAVQERVLSFEKMGGKGPAGIPHLDHVPSAADSGGCPGRKAFSAQLTGQGQLPNWPVKLRLIPESADFLDRCHLFLGADCAPAAAGGLGSYLDQDCRVALACPKFEDYFQLTAKLASMIKAHSIREVSVLEMEVPCCSPLHGIVLKACEKAGFEAKINRLVISRQGRLLSRENFTAGEEPRAL